MKKILLAVFVLLLSAPLDSSAQKVSKKEEKAAALVKQLDSLVNNRRFDFDARAYEENYGGIKRSGTTGYIHLYPTYTDFNLDGFKAERVSPGSYAVVATETGWVVVFTAKAIGLVGQNYYDGEFTTFRFELTVDHKGGAVLRVTTDFNDHKYPHVFRGSVSPNK